MPAYLKIGLKVAVTLGLFAYLFSLIDIKQVLAILVNADPWWFAAAVGCYSLGTIISGVRWWHAAWGLKIRGLPVVYFIRTYYVGMWFSQALPSGMGGDVVKAWDLKRKTGRLRAAVTSTLLERLSGFGALVGILLVMLPVLNTLLGGFALLHLIWVLLAASVAGAVGITVALRVKSLYKTKVGRQIWRLSRDVWRTFFSSFGRFFVQGFSSVCVQVLGVMVFWCLAKAIGAPMSVTVMMALCPLVFLVMVIPISLAGWGVREGAVVALFTMTGLMDSSAALSLSLLEGLVTLATALPGAVFFLSRRDKYQQDLARAKDAESLKQAGV